MKRKLMLLLLLLPLAVTVSAQSGSRESKALYSRDLNSALTGSKTTYLELIRKVLPDLQIDSKDSDVAIAHSTVPFKHLSEDAEATTLEGDIKLDSFQPRWIKSHGRRILLLELDMSAADANQGTNYEGESVLLAAFQMDPSMKLLTVMDVKTDRFTGFWETPSIFQLTAQSDAFLVNSTHSNAGEAYNDLTVLFLNNDRFETITNIFIFDTQGCGAKFTETPSFRVLPGTAKKYPNLLVRVKVKKDADTEECDHPTRGYIKSYQAVYHWNSAKSEYQTTSRQLEALDKFNRNRL